jgi:hypothetical protein
MLTMNIKKQLYTFLRPLKVWIDNNSCINLYELIDCIEEHLEYNDIEINESELIRFLSGICKINNTAEPSVNRIYI